MARITRDSIRIFSVTFSTVVTVYCDCNKQQNTLSESALRYNFLHSVLRCSSFRFKTVISLRLYLLCSCWDVQCCMLLFVLWVNKFKCSLKTDVKLVLATEPLKTVSGVVEVTSSYWRLLCGHLSNTDTSLLPFGVRIRKARLQNKLLFFLEISRVIFLTRFSFHF